VNPKFKKMPDSYKVDVLFSALKNEMIKNALPPT
jgi:hypothetical protein